MKKYCMEDQEKVFNREQHVISRHIHNVVVTIMLKTVPEKLICNQPGILLFFQDSITAVLERNLFMMNAIVAVAVKANNSLTATEYERTSSKCPSRSGVAT